MQHVENWCCPRLPAVGARASALGNRPALLWKRSRQARLLLRARTVDLSLFGGTTALFAGQAQAHEYLATQDGRRTAWKDLT